MKVLLSIDEGLLRRIDRKARAQGLSRSAYISELARRDVNRAGTVELAFKRLERIAARYPSAGDVTQDIRAERDAR